VSYESGISRRPGGKEALIMIEITHGDLLLADAEQATELDLVVDNTLCY
jgi:hypothetical protein